MWTQDNETGDWKPRALSILSIDDGGDAGAGGGDGDAGGGEPAGGEQGGRSGAPEFSLAMLEGITPAQLTADPSLAKDPTIAGYRNIDDLLRSHRSAQQMVGNPKAFVKLPTESSTAEERAAFYSALGRPEKADGYQFQEPEGLPENMPQVAPEFVSSFQETAHKLGINAEQARGLYDWFRSSEAAAFSQSAEQRTAAAHEATQALKQEWGAAYAQKLAGAEEVLSGLPQSLAQKLVASGLNNDPDIVRMLAEVADARGEDRGSRLGEPSGSEMTPAQAQSEIARLLGDETFNKAWLDKNHPGHSDAVAKLARLHQMKQGVAANG